MDAVDSCPSIELLRRSLDPDDSMSDEERRSIEAHLDSCPGDCKQKIAELIQRDTLANAQDSPLPDTSAGSSTVRTGEGLRQVSGYEILGELGRGGMGVVYKARHIGLDRIVALKMVRGGSQASIEDLQRFRTEARAIAQLAHPNIVQIHDIGECDGQPYFALEFVAGGNLHEKLAPGPMDPAAAAKLVRQLALAVDAVHRCGILHRDLKPGNVLLTPDGQPKITDFGLAKRDPASATPGDNEAVLTQTGTVLGTPCYMAPEQADGRNKLLSPATDVYALGAILYEALTGRPPFQSHSTLDVLMQVVSVEPTPPRRLRHDLPRDLDTICLKCLRKPPRDRYHSARDLADDLERFLDGRAINARRVGPVERAVKVSRRHPAALLAMLLVLMLVGIAGVFSIWLARRNAGPAAVEEERIEYFANFVRRWWNPEGIGPLTEEQARHRQYSFRLHSRGGKVEKIEVRDGHGRLTPKHQRAMYIGSLPSGSDADWLGIHECRFDYHRNADGQISNIVAYDRPGNIVWTFHFTTLTTAHTADAQGFPCPRAGSGAAYVKFEYSDEGFEREWRYLDSDGNPRADRAGIFGERRELDERGQELKTTYLGASGQPVGNIDGVCTTTMAYDERGDVIELAYFDVSGKPAVSWEGVARARLTHDDFGNLTEAVYFGPNNTPTLSRDGYARMVRSYDEHGDLIREAYFGLDGKPTFNRDGYASITTSYDNDGNRTALSYFDCDGKPTLMNQGCATMRYVDNERGDPLELTYFGTDGQRIAHKKGYGRISNKYDDKGNMTESAYFDVHDRPTLHADGYFRTTLTYDDRGKVLEQSYFGTDGRLCPNKDGFARSKRNYDNRGNIVETTFFGPDGKPTMHRDRYARWTAVYDDYGNRTEQTFFGLNGKPTRQKDGYARLTTKYDDHWHDIEDAYFNIDSRPVLCAEGYARRTAMYDQFGNMIEEAYFGVDDRPTPCSDGYARICKTYNERNRNIKEVFFGVDGEPALHKDGYAMIRARYDDRGNLVEGSYFDLQGNAVLSTFGAATTKVVCDERGNDTEAAFFGLDGEPVLRISEPGRNDGGYHRAVRKYDATGNRIDEADYGLDGKPILCAQGFFRKTMRRDERGRIVEEAYFGTDDKLCPGPEGVARFTKSFDAWGNAVDCHMFGPDGKPVLHSDGQGYARWTAKYDSAGDKIEVAYFGLDFKPVLIKEGYHAWTSEFDDNGNETKCSFFDCQGHPVRRSVSQDASWTAKYDDRGNVVDKTYFGIDGKPAACSSGYARVTAEFDSDSRQIALAYFDADGKRLPHRVTVVEVIPGSQAERLGLKPGDTLIRYDKKDVIGTAAFIQGRALEHGDQPRELEIRRDDQTLTVPVKPGQLGVQIKDRFP